MGLVFLLLCAAVILGLVVRQSRLPAAVFMFMFTCVASVTFLYLYFRL